jgi:PhnB protein
MKLQTYLNYGGNREQALRFYEKQLDGKITRLLTWDQMPGVKDLPPDRQKAILHARISIGELHAAAGNVFCVSL